MAGVNDATRDLHRRLNTYWRGLSAFSESLAIFLGVCSVYDTECVDRTRDRVAEGRDQQN